MAHNAQRGTISRRAWLLTGLAIPLSRALGSEPGLTASFDGDNLYPAGPKLHFLSGKVLERLRDSADTQTFFSQITLLIRGEQETVFKRTTQRFVVSYSIWEEKFKVSIPAPIALSKEGLTQSEAEQWTMENLAISASGLAPNQPFRMRFELRAPQQRDISNVLGNHGLSLSDSLIEFFSRKANAGDSPVSLETPWMLLRDLPRMVGRAARIG
jgi:hypothetical protein